MKKTNKNKKYMFNGKKYKVEFRNRKVIRTIGECDSPDTRGRKILLYTKGVSKKTLLEFALHEGMHAFDYSMEHKIVYKLSKDLANLLWGLGYRPIEKNDKKS